MPNGHLINLVRRCIEKAHRGGACCYGNDLLGRPVGNISSKDKSRSYSRKGGRKEVSSMWDNDARNGAERVDGKREKMQSYSYFLYRYCLSILSNSSPRRRQRGKAKRNNRPVSGQKQAQLKG